MRQARCPRCDERARAGTGKPWAITQPFCTHANVHEDGSARIPRKLPYTEFSPTEGAGRDLGVFLGVFQAGGRVIVRVIINGGRLIFVMALIAPSLEQLRWSGKREGFVLHVGLIDERFHEAHASEREVDDGLKI